MANKEAKKIAELTLGIDDIQVALDKAKEMIEKQSLEIGEMIAKNMKDSVTKSTASNPIDFGFNEKAVQDIKSSASEISDNLGDVFRTVTKYADEEKSKIASLDEYFEIAAGNIEKVHTSFTKKGKQVSITVDENTKVAEQAAERQKKAEEKKRQEYEKTTQQLELMVAKQKAFQTSVSLNKDGADYSKVIKDSKTYMEMLEDLKNEIIKNQGVTKDQQSVYNDLVKDIKKLEVEYKSLKETQKSLNNEEAQKAKERAAQLAEEERKRKELFNMTYRLTEKEKKEQNKKNKEYNITIQQIDRMIEKQKAFGRVVSRQKGTVINREIIEKNREYIAQLEKMQKELRETGEATQEAKSRLQEMGSKVKALSGRYQEAGFHGESFLKQITDKAKWLSAFYIVDGLKQAMIETARTIKETEDAAVELQRVLSKDVGMDEISDRLYKIAQQYGRSFADVQEVAVKFAQTGADWNDVLKLTESAMLALNTAELDVTQSTQGLIAIMSQWNIEAEDMESVIDRINITADSFAVTSEKIIAALQRSSSSAKNAGLTLEETIGVITALSEATGRTGETIGTALNSLVIYTSKAKALETFYEVGNATVKKTVDAYRHGSATILDVWKALAENLTQLSEKQQTALLSGVETNELGIHLEQEAAQITEDIKEIYGSAGTFRQNYLVALLNDIGTVEEVTDNMSGAIGYSAEENEKYMQTLTASIYQMISTWKELLVETGEGKLGLLDLFKIMVEAATQIGVVTKSLGGLVPVLFTISGVLLQIKSYKINSAFAETLRSATVRARAFHIAMLQAGGGLKGFTVATKSAIGASLSLTSVLGMVQVALGVVIMAFSHYKQKQEEVRQATIESNNEAIKQTNHLRDLVTSYEALSNVSNSSATTDERLNDLNKQITESLGDRAEALKGLKEGTVEYRNELERLTKQELENRRTQLAANKKMMEEDFLEGNKSFIKNNLKIWSDSLEVDDEEIKSKIEETLGKFKKYEKQYGSNVGYIPGDRFSPESMGMKGYYAPDADDIDDVMEWVASLQRAKDELDKLGRKSEEAGEYISNTEAYQKISEALNSVNAGFKNYLDSLVQVQINEVLIRDGFPKTAEELKGFKEEVFEATGANDVFKSAIFGLVDDAFPALSEAVESSAETVEEGLKNIFALTDDEIKAIEKSFKALNSVIDTSQAAFDGANDAIKEFQSTGLITVDTIQKLTAGGYDFIKALDFTQDGLRLTENATTDLVNSQKQNVLQMIKQAAATDILKFAEEYLANEMGNAQTQNENFSSSLEGTKQNLANITMEAIGSADAVNQFSIELAKLSKATLPADFDRKTFEDALTARVNTWNNYYNYIENNIGNIAQYSKSATKDAAKTQKDAIKDLKDAENDRYKAEKDRIEKLKKASKDKFDDEQKAIEAQKKALKEQYDKQKDALQEQKELIKDRYKEQIDALKEVQKENDRLDKQEEYLRNKRNAERDKAKASVRSGIQYREKEAEADEKISDLNSEWRKVLRDWEVEDKIKALEKLRDEQIKVVDDRLKALEAQHKLEISSLDKQLQASKALEEQEKKRYETQLQALKEEHEAKIKKYEEDLKALDHANKAGATSYKNNYANPKKEISAKTDMDIAENTLKTQEETNKKSLTLANYTAQQLYDIYMKNFVNPIGKEIEKATHGGGSRDFGHGGGSRDFGYNGGSRNWGYGGGSRDFGVVPTIPFALPLSFAPANNTTTYTTTTTNSNSNVTNNIWGDSNAKKNFNSFFTKP